MNRNTQNLCLTVFQSYLFDRNKLIQVTYYLLLAHWFILFSFRARNTGIHTGAGPVNIEPETRTVKNVRANGVVSTLAPSFNPNLKLKVAIIAATCEFTVLL